MHYYLGGDSVSKKKTFIFLATGIWMIASLLISQAFPSTVPYLGISSAYAQEYKGRVFYEIFVRAFNDSNGDHIGDIKGVTQKLDYLQNLGIKGIWLMPINPAAGYHGYDVTDYDKIDRTYGNIDALKEFVTEAHKRDILVILDLVTNHTSDQHPWFQQAIKDQNSKYYNYYVWANSKTNLSDENDWGGKLWHKAANNQYYEGLFWEHMPDLNYNNPDVRKEMKNIAKYYLDFGIDGFRLDAAKWIYDNDKLNVQWWTEFNDYVKSVNENAFLVGEVWDNNPSIPAKYLNTMSCFNFAASAKITNGLQTQLLKPIAGHIKDIYNTYAKVNPNFVDSPFLDNHDINRIMSSVGTIEKAKKAAAILLTLPGVPYVYYGEETGMTGAKPDEQIRQPFIWSNIDKAKNTRWEPIRNNVAKVAVSVQSNDPNSLLNFYKKLITLRNKNDVLKFGSFEEVPIINDSVAAYKRVLDNNAVYVYMNDAKDTKHEQSDIGQATVLYSNKRSQPTINLNGDFELKGDEILIIEKIN